MGVFVSGWCHVRQVESVDMVFHEVEVSREDGGVCVFWWDFTADFLVESGPLWFFVMAGMVVCVDDLKRPHGSVVEGDAECSSFFDFVDVASCDGVEVF